MTSHVWSYAEMGSWPTWAKERELKLRLSQVFVFFLATYSSFTICVPRIKLIISSKSASTWFIPCISDSWPAILTNLFLWFSYTFLLPDPWVLPNWTYSCSASNFLSILWSISLTNPEHTSACFSAGVRVFSSFFLPKKLKLSFDLLLLKSWGKILAFRFFCYLCWLSISSR